jgi:hypothetical protein
MMATALGPQTPPRRHPDAASRIYDGEAFIVLPHHHSYKILNKVGSRVWDLIDGTRTAGGIADVIAEEYDVPRDTALKDVNDFVGELEANGMLAPRDAGKVA